LKLNKEEWKFWEMKLDVAKCHACHLVPRLPRKVKVDVTKCHSCHAKSRGVHGDS